MARKLVTVVLVAAGLSLTPVTAAGQEVQVVPTGKLTWELSAPNLEKAANNRWFGKTSTNEVTTCAATATTVTAAEIGEPLVCPTHEITQRDLDQGKVLLLLAQFRSGASILHLLSHPVTAIGIVLQAGLAGVSLLFGSS